MKKDVPEVQVVYVTEKYIPARNNKTVNQRGDFPVMLVTAPTPASIPRALADAYQNNRVADIFIVILLSDPTTEYTYEAKTFEDRLSRFIGVASRPGMTHPKFLETFSGKLK